MVCRKLLPLYTNIAPTLLAFSCVDTMIKKLEETITSRGLTMESLTSKLEGLQFELRLKEDDFKHLSNSKENLVNERTDLLSCNQRIAKELDMALLEIKNLEEFVNLLAANLTELDNQSLTISDKVMQLNNFSDSCFKLVQEERNLSTMRAQQQYDQLHDRFLHATSERDALELVNQDLKNKVNEIKKDQEFAMVQHAEECRLAEERIRIVESKAESLLSRKNEMETLITTLEEKIHITSENAQLLEKMKVSPNRPTWRYVMLLCLICYYFYLAARIIVENIRIRNWE